MAVPKLKVRELIPIVQPRTGDVHATSLDSPGETACGKKCNGWKVAPASEPYSSRVNCDDCKREIFYPVARGRAKKPKAKAAR